MIAFAQSGRTNQLYLSLGIVLGSLMDEAVMDSLTESLRAGDLHADYVRLVRDKLTQALDASAFEG